MSPSDETSFATSGGSRKATYTIIGIKFVELLLIICLMGLIDEPASHSHTTVFITPRVVALCYVTFGCYIIYTSIYLIMALFGDITSWRTAALWSLIAFVLFIAVTALLFRDWSTTKDRNYWHPNMQRLDLILASACISLITCLIYLVDILATIRFGLNGDVE